MAVVKGKNDDEETKTGLSGLSVVSHGFMGVEMPPISSATPRSKISSFGMSGKKDDRSFLEKVELANVKEVDKGSNA